MDLFLISFPVQIISHCTHMPAFMFLVISRYTFGLCLLSAIMNNAAMNIHVQILCAHTPGCVPGSIIAGSYINSKFLRNC